MKKRWITFFQFVFFLSLGIFLIWWMVRGVNAKEWQQIKQSLAHARYWLFVPVMIILLLAHWSRAIRWRLLMEPMGLHPKKWNTFFAVMIGYLANLAFPRLGEVLKCTVLARYEKVPPDKLVGTMVTERAVDVVSLVLVFAITIMVQNDLVGSYAKELVSGIFKSETGPVSFGWRITILTMALVLLLYIFYRLLKKYQHFSFIKKIRSLVKGIWSGISSIRYVQHKGLFLLHSVFIWLMYYLASWVGLMALEETAHLGPKAALSVLSFGSIGMIATPGGLGGYPYALQKTLGIYDIPQNIGLLSGSVNWVAQTAVLVIFGLLSLVLLPAFNKK